MASLYHILDGAGSANLMKNMFNSGMPVRAAALFRFSISVILYF